MVRKSIVPIANLMDVLSGRQRSASRHANRAGRIGFSEERASSGKRVQVWCVIGWVAVAARDVLLVLVGENEEEIGFLAHSVS